jgi:hypothetical protein
MPNVHRLLSLAAGLNSRGIHLRILKELLASGYDCSLDIPYTDLSAHWLVHKGREPLLRSFYQDGGESEPFLLKFLMECSKNAFGEFE